MRAQRTEGCLGPGAMNSRIRQTKKQALLREAIQSSPSARQRRALAAPSSVADRAHGRSHWLERNASRWATCRVPHHRGGTELPAPAAGLGRQSGRVGAQYDPCFGVDVPPAQPVTNDQHMNERPSVAYHLGPGLDYHVGGMASVIDQLVSQNVGADVVKSIPTWWAPHAHLRSATLTAKAAAAVLRLPTEAVVHVHMSARGSFVREGALLAVAKRRGMRRIVTIHGHHFAGFSRKRPTVAGRILGLASAVTVLTEQDLQVVREVAPGTRVELMPNPVDVDTQSGSAAETDELVLFAGEIGVRKGADVLHRAWPMVLAARPRARCIVVGPPTELELAALDHFALRPPISRSAIGSLIREARVIALPSRGEALPMILAEAMAAGRPFVSTPVGGITAIAASGLLTPVGDEAALAHALVQLLADPGEAARLGSLGQRMCKDWMSPAAIDTQLRRLYAEV
jgi:glycosyltransferase involved in cell wall biosynthesis